MNLVNVCPDDLLGAYALDAVDDEGEAVTAHLAECPRCRHEVARHREIVSLLVADRLSPPDRVWDRLMADLEEAPPLLRLADFAPARAPRRPIRPWAALAAVAAMAVVALGVRSTLPGGGADRSQTALQRSALSAVSDPSAAKVQLTSADPSGGRGQVVLLEDGRGYAIFDGLPSLPAGRTYQLWALRDGERIPAGVLGSNPTVTAFDLHGPAAGFAVTDEPAGGVSTSTNVPMMLGWLTA